MALIWLVLLAFLFLALLKIALATSGVDNGLIVTVLVLLTCLALALAAQWYYVPLRIGELSNASTIALGKERVVARHGRSQRVSG